VEISENSENRLKAIVGGRQVAGMDRLSESGEKVVEKPQGEGKAAKNGSRKALVWVECCLVGDELIFSAPLDISSRAFRGS
jgi:hypothetical protein